MYESYFGFERAPFNNVPDTSFFFGSSRHNEALAQVLFAVEARKGFAVLTGEVERVRPPSPGPFSGGSATTPCSR